ncbi:amidohydrolase family protein [Crocinitomicaceae bacterium]|nr:amidohydrolase family protein [Crocinitomicaceae bacterium]
MKYLTLIFSLLFVQISIWSQFRPQNGVAPSKSEITAITNAHIYVSSTEEYKKASILIQEGKVLKIGKKIKIPKGAQVIDLQGRTILPAFIELNSNIGIVKQKKKSPRSFRPQIESNKGSSFYWNEAVHPEVDASLMYSKSKAAIKEINQKGFGFFASHSNEGIVRGTGLLVSANGDNLSSDIISPKIASYFSLIKGDSKQSYPSSQMGSIALLRQSFYDFQYYSKSDLNFTDLSMEAWKSQMHLPKFFQTEDKLEILRASKIANEFNLNFIYLGSGNEYEAIDPLKTVKPKLVIPINFPDAYDVSDPYISRLIPLSQLKHWELAPLNFKILLENNIEVAISSSGLKSTEQFWKNIRLIIQSGVDKTDVLKALTETPASFIEQGESMGRLEKDMLASFTVFSSDPFTDKNAKANEIWLKGERKPLVPFQKIEVKGSYRLNRPNNRFVLEFSGAPQRLKVSLYDADSNGEKVDSTKTKVAFKLVGNDVTLTLKRADSIGKFAEVLHGKITPNGAVMEGDIVLKDGTWEKWSAIRFLDSENEDSSSDPQVIEMGKCWFPNISYGLDSTLQQESILFTNATIWTNENEGVLREMDVLVENGKIAQIGKGLKSNDMSVKVIDASGMHLTSGIIDEHSHIAISKGVNESGQAISAEVSISDVVNSEDVNIYRQLAGGVTCSQLLHGSANPIGGQSAIVKLKWGEFPEKMLIQNAPGFIKFALGENVKQSNWGNFNTIRFPQTRMGVEQVFYDGFHRARIYNQEWENYLKKNKGKSILEPRVDLELQTLSEILKSDRFITCHSYVQSEINMLMHVADSMGFRVNTFTHILEGYKLADKMREHGVGGSTFSDWWAYKYEVNDAIPYNASLMHDNGVVVAINSDDAEMGRRLNQEAAKGVKYGGMSQEDAWKMVTLNPAKLLHLDDRMGSVKVGKDADLVLWTHNPLSIMAKVSKTIIDGTIYFDSDRKMELENRNIEERARIIQKMILNREAGNPVKKYEHKKEKFYHCDSFGEEGETSTNTH